jgi:hypothetical protein
MTTKKATVTADPFGDDNKKASTTGNGDAT